MMNFDYWMGKATSDLEEVNRLMIRIATGENVTASQLAALAVHCSQLNNDVQRAVGAVSAVEGA